MQVGVMTTDGGPHRAEQWAVTTSGQIIQIAATASGKQAAEARKLEIKVIDILEAAHGHVQDHEREMLEKHGKDRYGHPLDPSEHVDDPYDAVMEACDASSWKAHYANPEVREHVRRVIGQHFVTSMAIERRWHEDRSA